MNAPPVIARPVLAPFARLRRDRIRGQDQIVFPEGVLEVNASGAEIVKLCDGRATGEIITELEARFPGAAPAADVTGFLIGLLEKGLLRDAG